MLVEQKRKNMLNILVTPLKIYPNYPTAQESGSNSDYHGDFPPEDEKIFSESPS